MPSLRLSRRLVPALAAVLLAAACDQVAPVAADADMPLVQVLTMSASPGSTVALRLANDSGSNWGYNPCGSPRYERREGDAWVDAPLPLIFCTAELYSLENGRVQDVSIYLPEGYVAGTYRVRFRLLRSDGAEISPVSNTFTVE